MIHESRKRALVTGCCGFVGSHLVSSLMSAGWIVDGIDDMSNGAVENVNHLRENWKVRVVPVMLASTFARVHENERCDKTLLVFEGDFCAPVLFGRIVEKRYDVIFHLAAEPSVEVSVKNPAMTAFNNLQKSVELMAVSVGAVQRFVFASSAAVYGNQPADAFPLTERTTPNPSSPYALQKLQVEQTGKLFNELYGTEFVALRMFNVYGPRQEGASPYSTVIAAWCDKIRRGLSLRLDGDGTQSRDLVYVGDVCDAFLAAAECSLEGGYETLNVATGVATTNGSILKHLLDRWPELKIDNTPARLGDVKYSVASMEKNKQFLRTTKITSISEGLILTLKSWDLWDEI